MEIKLSESVTI